jgi:hypothetical protein
MSSISIVRTSVQPQNQTSYITNTGAGDFADTTSTNEHELTEFDYPHAQWCCRLWYHSPDKATNTGTLNIRIEAEYLGSRAAITCPLCSVIANAVGQCTENCALEAVTLHTSSVGGPLDMVVWLVNGDTKSFELYTHSGKQSVPS